jgi:amino acid transporter
MTMGIKKAYHFFFYKLYKFYESAPSKWLSDWKALFSLLVIEIWIFIAAMTYYKVFTKRDLIYEDNLETASITIVIALALINYFVFGHQDRWKTYVKEFDSWSKKKSRIGTVVAWLVVFFILANMIFAFYLMSQINWKQYK